MLRAVLAVIVFSAAIACTDARTFNGEQWALLDSYRLPGAPPPRPSNSIADDPRAAPLGRGVFFDARFSGPPGPPNDAVSNGSLGLAGTAGKISCASCHEPLLGGTDHRSRPAATSFAAG